MAKLSDIQILLLTTASSREDGSLLPPSDLLGELSTRVRKAIESLLRRGLVEEMPVNASEQVWRIEDDKQIGLAITAPGKSAIGADAVTPDPDSLPATAAPILTKISLVLGLLQRQGGATLDDIVEATGWLPHTTRAALTSLRKKGHIVTRTMGEVGSCYRIIKAS
ncbi:MAG: DUF3489 domain-containing protein [Thermomicrobiales bacterium]